MYMRRGKNMRGGRNMSKEEFIENFRNVIQEKIPEFNPTNEEIERLFNDYYIQNPNFNAYVEGVELEIEDAFEDGDNLSLSDILDNWDESDVTTVATETPTTIDINDDDEIEDYLGGKRKSKKVKTNKKRSNKRKSKKRNGKKTRGSKKSRRTKKTRKNYKGGKSMTDTIYTEPIAYKEDEYDQQKNALNYKP